MSPSIIPARTITVIVEDSTIDLVCFEVALAALADPVRAGRLHGYVQATLENNPGLARYPILPLGHRIALPEYVVAAPAPNGVRLWE